MSIFFKDQYCTFWRAEETNGMVKGSISTSEKDSRNEGKYINSNWNVMFVGKVKELALSLPEGTRLKANGKISNSVKEYDGVKKYFTNYTIFDFEIMESNKPAFQPAKSSKPVKATENQAGNGEEEDPDQLPF